MSHDNKEAAGGGAAISREAMLTARLTATGSRSSHGPVLGRVLLGSRRSHPHQNLHLDRAESILGRPAALLGDLSYVERDLYGVEMFLHLH